MYLYIYTMHTRSNAKDQLANWFRLSAIFTIYLPLGLFRRIAHVEINIMAVQARENERAALSSMLYRGLNNLWCSNARICRSDKFFRNGRRASPSLGLYLLILNGDFRYMFRLNEAKGGSCGRGDVVRGLASFIIAESIVWIIRRVAAGAFMYIVSFII